MSVGMTVDSGGFVSGGEMMRPNIAFARRIAATDFYLVMMT